MAKRQGLWRPRPKIDQAEFEAAETRVAARLADLFSVEAPASDGDVLPAEASDEEAEAGSPTEAEADSPTEADQELEMEAVVLPLWPGGPRPAIVVEGQFDLVDVMPEPARAEPDLVGVMARPDEAVTAAVAVPSEAVPSDAVTAAVPSAAVALSSAAVASAAIPGAGASHRRKAPAGATEPRRVDAVIVGQ